MSMDSPAKKERIERHLMRQRGAGVRTVSATFGFAFGSSAPSSQEHTPISIEPAAKRRKTVLSHEIVVSDGSADRSSKEGKADSTTQVKKTKPRKRWAPQDDDAGSIMRSHTLDDDDSFIGGLKAAKTAAKKSAELAASEKRARDVDAAIESPTVTSKSRRRAAVKAAVKSADDLEEENVPEDNKRRAAAAKAKRAKPSRTKRRQDGTTGVAEDVIETIDTAATSTRAKRGAKASKSKTAVKAATGDTIEFQLNHNMEPSQIQNLHQAKLSEPTSRKRKKREALTEVGAADEIVGIERTEAHPKLQPKPDPSAIHEGTDDIPLKKTEKKAPGRTTAMLQSTVNTTQQSQRVPLKESDPNVTIHSASPDKTGAKPPAATSTKRKASEPVELAKSEEQDQARSSKRRKMQVRQDETSSEQTEKNRSCSIQPSVNGTHQPTGETKQQKQPKIAKETATHEEDIDWLFQDPNIKQHSSMPRKQSAPQKKAPRTPKKLAEIDLDDLLSNIASFAQVETKPRPSTGQTVDNENKKTAGIATKRKSRR